MTPEQSWRPLVPAALFAAASLATHWSPIATLSAWGLGAIVLCLFPDTLFDHRALIGINATVPLMTLAATWSVQDRIEEYCHRASWTAHRGWDAESVDRRMEFFFACIEDGHPYKTSVVALLVGALALHVGVSAWLMLRKR